MREFTIFFVVSGLALAVFIVLSKLSEPRYPPLHPPLPPERYGPESYPDEDDEGGEPL